MTDPVRLQRLRAEVDDIDFQLVQLMAARQRLVEAVAAVKGDVRRVRDRARERAVLARVRDAALAAGLSPAIAVPVWDRLLDASVKHERRILAAAGEPEAACCGCRHADG